MGANPSPSLPDDGEPTVAPGALDADAAARGTVYALLESAFDHPSERLYEALATEDLREELSGLLTRTPLEVSTAGVVTGDDYETLCARYNDLFVVGYSEYEDRTDGSLSTDEPPVPLYESAYRPEASWTDVNLDLARAYDYYGVRPASSEREHHDHLGLVLEFAGYLARREAVNEGDDDARARLDLLDRHLRILVEGVRERIESEPNPGAYGEFARFLDEFTAAERADLADRLEGG